MRWINTDKSFVPLACQMVGIRPNDFTVAISEWDDTDLIAVMVFDQFSGRSVVAHQFVMEGRRPSRIFYYALGDYLFNQLKVTNVVGLVPSSNKKALALNPHIGFKEIARIPNFYENGDEQVIMILTEDTVFNWRACRPRNFQWAA